MLRPRIFVASQGSFPKSAQFYADRSIVRGEAIFLSFAASCHTSRTTGDIKKTPPLVNEGAEARRLMASVTADVAHVIASASCRNPRWVATKTLHLILYTKFRWMPMDLFPTEYPRLASLPVGHVLTLWFCDLTGLPSSEFAMLRGAIY